MRVWGEMPPAPASSPLAAAPCLLLLRLLYDRVARPGPPLRLLRSAALESSSLPPLRAAWPGEMIQLGTWVLGLGLSWGKLRMPQAAGSGQPVNFCPPGISVPHLGLGAELLAWPLAYWVTLWIPGTLWASVSLFVQ